VALLTAPVLSCLVPSWRLSLELMALGAALNLVALFGWRLLFAAFSGTSRM
jgi:hypothetical protein